MKLSTIMHRTIMNLLYYV